jgi:hypothetical protein
MPTISFSAISFPDTVVPLAKPITIGPKIKAADSPAAHLIAVTAAAFMCGFIDSIVYA